MSQRKKISKSNEAISISPEQIRRVVAEITNIPLREVVHIAPPELSRGGVHETYFIAHDDGVLTCGRASDGWLVSLSFDRETVARTWSTRTSNAPAETHLQFIQYVLKLDSPPKFRLYYDENGEEIIRRTFDTNIGPVRVSSRRSGQGQTEIIFETFATKQVFRLVQDRQSGKIDLSAREFLDAPPF